MACKCEKQEVGQGSGTVKGYVTTVECDECKARREADNIARAIKDAESKVIADKEALIQAKIRETAITDLTAEGKLSVNGEVVKVDL